MNRRAPVYEKALDKARVLYRFRKGPGTQHAFHNDTSHARYNAKAAKHACAWTLALFEKRLKS